MIFNPILFGVSGLAYFISGGRRGQQKCPTLVFSKLEMVWQLSLTHNEAILCQVKINCEFSKWRIIFDDVSITLRNTVKFTIFWYTLLTGVAHLTPIFKKMVFSSKHNMEMTKNEKLLKKTKKKFSGIFFDMTSSKKGRGSGLS